MNYLLIMLGALNILFGIMICVVGMSSVTITKGQELFRTKFVQALNLVNSKSEGYFVDMTAVESGHKYRVIYMGKEENVEASE